MSVTFCVECGGLLETRAVFGRIRPACPTCGHIHFDDPKIAVGVVASRDGKILLTRRNHEPKLGEWSFPAGFADAGENVAEAAAREALEETGVRVEVGPLLGVFQEHASRVVFLAYAATAGEEEPICGDECLDVRYFAVSELPPLAFSTDPAILYAWRRHVAAGSPTPKPGTGSAGT